MPTVFVVVNEKQQFFIVNRMKNGDYRGVSFLFLWDTWLGYRYAVSLRITPIHVIPSLSIVPYRTSTVSSPTTCCSIYFLPTVLPAELPHYADELQVKAGKKSEIKFFTKESDPIRRFHLLESSSTARTVDRGTIQARGQEPRISQQHLQHLVQHQIKNWHSWKVSQTPRIRGRRKLTGNV